MDIFYLDIFSFLTSPCFPSSVLRQSISLPFFRDVGAKRKKMSTSFSSAAFAISLTKTRVHKNFTIFNSKSIFSSNFSPRTPASLHRLVTSFPDNQGRQSNGQPCKSSFSSSLEGWIIAFEQAVNIFLTDSVIKILDILYHGERDYAKFFVLETIARVPYFAFMSVLHVYESCGWWRRTDYLKVHFAESWNEMHHLLIMEELGGNDWWFDRFLAQHVAIAYYITTVIMYAINPRMTYHFSECVESHAFATYEKFIKTRGEELKKLPAPDVAVKYYTGGDLYMFDEFQTSRPLQSRRPKIENLYDVFVNIRDDEAEHCKTMKACQTHGNLRSPHSCLDNDRVGEAGCVLPQADCEGILDCLKKSFPSQLKL